MLRHHFLLRIARVRIGRRPRKIGRSPLKVDQTGKGISLIWRGIRRSVSLLLFQMAYLLSQFVIFYNIFDLLIQYILHNPTLIKKYAMRKKMFWKVRGFIHIFLQKKTQDHLPCFRASRSFINKANCDSIKAVAQFIFSISDFILCIINHESLKKRRKAFSGTRTKRTISVL